MWLVIRVGSKETEISNTSTVVNREQSQQAIKDVTAKHVHPVEVGSGSAHSYTVNNPGGASLEECDWDAQGEENLHQHSETRAGQNALLHTGVHEHRDEIYEDEHFHDDEDDFKIADFLGKWGNLLASVPNFFAAGSIGASILRGVFEGKNGIWGGEEGFYNDKKLSSQRLPFGEKIGWLSYKLGAFGNAVATCLKYFSTKNPQGFLGGLMYLLSVPVLDKMLGTMTSIIGFNFGALGMSEEGEEGHFEQKELAESQWEFFNPVKIASAITTSWEDALEFLKHPVKNFPLGEGVKTKYSMRFTAFLSMFASVGALLAKGINNEWLKSIFITTDKATTAMQATTEFVQAVREKWDSSEIGTPARLAAIYQMIGAGAYIPAELKFDSKAGRGVLAPLGSAFWNLNAASASLKERDRTSTTSEEGRNLNIITIVTGIGSFMTGALTSALFNKTESRDNWANQMLRALEFNTAKAA